MITNWHEMEFARNKRYNGGKSNGINGALAFWWNATNHVSAGVQYRYADNKLGDTFYQDAIIYTLKYTF